MQVRNVPPVNKRLCRVAAAVAGVAALAFVAGNAAEWLVPQWAEEAARNATRLRTEPVFMRPLVQWVGLGVTTLHLCVLAWGLLSMRTLFKLLAAGEVFVAETGVLLRRFGKALLIYATLTPIVRSALAPLVTYDPVKHQGFVSFGIQDYEIIIALVGALILAFGSVMADATRIADENREIV
jgi:hypothetical protein